MTAYRIFINGKISCNISHTTTVEGLSIYLIFYTWFVCIIFVPQLETSARTIFIETQPTLSAVFAATIFAYVCTGAVRACYFLIMNHRFFCKGNQNQRISDTTLYPDLGAYEAWSEKAQALRAYARSVHVSKLLEDKATLQDKAGGLDLADYLIRRDDRTGWALSKGGYPVFWDW